MKPEKLGNFKPEDLGETAYREIDKALDYFKNSSRMRLGSIIDIRIPADSSIVTKMVNHSGCELNYSGDGDPSDFPAVIAVKGSVGLHDDIGLGKVLSWILHLSPLSGHQAYKEEKPSLIAESNGSMFVLEDLDEGDLFVFDADQKHGWISNFECVLAQVPIL